VIVQEPSRDTCPSKDAIVDLVDRLERVKSVGNFALPREHENQRVCCLNVPRRVQSVTHCLSSATALPLGLRRRLSYRSEYSPADGPVKAIVVDRCRNSMGPIPATFCRPSISTAINGRTVAARNRLIRSTGITFRSVASLSPGGAIMFARRPLKARFSDCLALTVLSKCARLHPGSVRPAASNAIKR